MSIIRDPFGNHIIIDNYIGYARVAMHVVHWGQHGGLHVELFPKELRDLATALNKAADEVEGKA